MKSDKSTVNPYLTFPGNCKEVMEFYKEALNGQLDLMPFEGSPVEVPADYTQKVLHATLTFEGAVIMASDGMPGQEINFGNSISISIAANELEKARRYFNNLAKGGTIIMPFAKTFWGAEFGMLIDKFGIQWMVNCEVEEG